MKICLTALIALGGTSMTHADLVKKLPAAMMPVPGNMGVSMTIAGSRGHLPLVTTDAHPLFESSYTGATNQVLATTKYGNVTSRDLYVWMLMRGSSNRAYLPELLDKVKFPKEQEKLAKALKAEIDDYVFYNYITPQLMPSAPADPVYDLKHYVYTLPVWQTIFLQKIVEPGVQITQADRQKYLQENTPELLEPQRLRTRYIFMRSAETDPALQQTRVEVDLDELRASILRGEISFAEAARQHSQAPSAKRGGEIPPFQHDELFFQFENAAAELEPGGISRVFRGPNGFYLVQLVEVLEPEEASLSNTRIAKEVDEGLSRKVLKAAYDIYLRDMLLERRRIVEKPQAWDSLEDNEIVGEVCDFVISKGQLRSAWPAVEGNDLKLNYAVMTGVLRTMLEREAMAQEVRALGFASDPVLERARWMAGNIIRHDAWMDSLRATLPISEQLVRNFWENHPDLFTPLSLKRIIKLTMRPSNTAPLPTQTRLELDQVLAAATGQPPTIPVAKFEPQDEEQDGLVPDVEARTAEAFEMLTDPQSEPNFYTDEWTPESLESIIDSVPEVDTEITPLEGQPAPGMDILPSPSAVTTNTLESLVTPASDNEVSPAEPGAEGSASELQPQADVPATTGVLDLETTAPQGGAAPTPAGGGIGPAGIQTQPDTPVRPIDEKILNPTGSSASTPSPRGSAAAQASREDELALPAEKGPTRGIIPAVTPTGGSVPAGVSSPVIPPGLELQEAKKTPNPMNQLKPPQTSSVPYNPEWFYARMNETQIQKVVGQYASSDWLLVMEDLGFVYASDLEDAPRRLEQVPIGAFSRPVVRGQDAIAWYIEDARKVERPPFEEIKTHAYDIFRSVQLDKATADTYNSELKKAGIDYKF